MSAKAQCVNVHRVACSGPGDLSGVQALIDSAELCAADIVAVMGKTEGNGCVNDFTRDFAATSWCHFLSSHLGCTPAAVAQRVALVMSGGTEGVLSPHFTVFSRRWVEPGSAAPSALPGQPRLVIGIAHTRDFLPEEIGRRAQIDATAAALRQAMQQAGIDDAAQVHFVQVKCPLLTTAKIHAAVQRAALPVTHDSYESMGYSRGASALGVALGLGEISFRADLAAAVLNDWSLYSARASCSAGVELEGNVVVVLGEVVGAVSPHRIAHTVMRDAIDAASVRHLLQQAFALDDTRSAAAWPRLVNVLAKAEASPDGRVRTQRHTMLNDSDINATRHARAAVGGVLASIAGSTALYVSGGAEHQGPPGGGPVAVIVQVEPARPAQRAAS